MDKKLSIVENIRLFNRFYFVKSKLLFGKYLNSNYSAAEARILFEIFENKKCTANFVAQKLNLDKGYLSRIIKRFEGDCLIKRTPSKKDARFFDITLTSKGLNLVQGLIKKSNSDIENLIQGLSPDDCEVLVSSMNTIIEKMQNIRRKML